MKTRCLRCGTEFECSPAGGPCWCTELPPLPITKDISAETCLCRSCLQQRVEDALREATP